MLIMNYQEKERTNMDPAISTYVCLSEQQENTNSKDSYSPVFIAALFIITKVSKQPKDLLMDK